jgi:thiamine pyrophosphate-dependent acetolactate synthase large subunit-like protein
MDPSLSLQHWPDLANVARGFGLEAATVTSTEELQAAMQAIASGDRKRPRLIDIQIDPACMPIGH